MATPGSQIGNAVTNLPTISRLFAEDYRDAPKWFANQFISTMNLFMTPTYSILNQGIDLTTNTRWEEYSFSFSCQSGTASSNTLSFIPRKYIGKPFAVVVAQCYNSTAASPTAIGNPVTIDWYFSGNQVNILAIYGLTSGQTYSISLLLV